MGRFPFFLLVACMAAAAASACTSGSDQAFVPPGGPIAVNVTCRDTGHGIGVRVHPWRAHSGDSTEITWHLAADSQPVRTVLSPVDSTRWPFDSLSYSWSQGMMSTRLRQGADSGAYRYRLEISCPSDTILIDPIFVVDH